MKKCFYSTAGVLLLTTILSAGCASLQEEDLIGIQAQTDKESVSLHHPAHADSTTIKSIIQSTPQTILLLHINNRNGKFVLELSEEEANALGIPSTMYNNVLSSLK